jgi:tetrapyrrole methylase family protein / MazG family protein
VFGHTRVSGAGEVMANWETLKAQEKTERTHALDGIAKGLPALMRAYKLCARAAKTGFDWPDAASAWKKVQEEEKELQQAVAASDRDATEEELGDLFFALAVYTRKLDLEPETTLNRANNKFQKRFEALEAQVKAEGKDWKELSLEELENRWQQAKKVSKRP